MKLTKEAMNTIKEHVNRFYEAKRECALAEKGTMTWEIYSTDTSCEYRTVCTLCALFEINDQLIFTAVENSKSDFLGTMSVADFIKLFGVRK